MQPEAARPAWLFDDFVPGREIGVCTEAIDAALVAQLRTVYGLGGRGLRRPEAAALAMVLMMRAYLGIVAPRPPGNIHARQQFKLHALPEMGEQVQTHIRCQGKTLHKQRRYVDFHAAGKGRGGRPLFTGVLTLIWAA